MKRVWIAIVIVFVALAGVIGWQVLSGEREPVYKGRTLTSWLEDLANAYAQMAPSSTLTRSVLTLREAQVKEAVHQIGTNAIPTLLRLLRVRDSALKSKVMGLLQSQHVIKVQFTPASYWNHVAAAGFNALHTNAQAAVPDLIEIANQNISHRSACEAIYSLGCIGPPAKPAVPHLLQWTTNADAGVRQNAIWTLGKIGPSRKAAVPFLLQCATNDLAKWSLVQIDPEAAAKAGLIINGGINRP